MRGSDRWPSTPGAGVLTGAVGFSAAAAVMKLREPTLQGMAVEDAVTLVS